MSETSKNDVIEFLKKNKWTQWVEKETEEGSGITMINLELPGFEITLYDDYFEINCERSKIKSHYSKVCLQDFEYPKLGVYLGDTIIADIYVTPL